jgi:small subunit ribosomal protein S17
MAKALNGIVTSTKMANAVVVEVTRKIPHPKYKKLLKRSKKFTVALNGFAVAVGDTVSISETRPIAKTIQHMISGKQEKTESRDKKTALKGKAKEEKKV